MHVKEKRSHANISLNEIKNIVDYARNANVSDKNHKLLGATFSLLSWQSPEQKKQVKFFRTFVLCNNCNKI